MRRAFKLFAFITFTLVLFLVAASLAFYHLIQVGEFRRFLISEIEQKTNLKVQLGEADFELGRIVGIAFRDVVVTEPDNAQHAIMAQRLTARVALLPLLRRNLIFYEIRLHKPSARLFRNEIGNIPLLDRLVNLPLFRESDGQFVLDLRVLKIADGAVELHDTVSGAPPKTTRLHEVDLELERVQGRALGDFFHKFVPTKSNQTFPLALKFDLRSGVDKDGQQLKLRAKGAILFPEESMELETTWWNAEARLMEVPAALAVTATGIHWPVKSLSGTVDSRLQLEGNLKQRIHVKGEIMFKQFAVEAPEYFSAPLTPGDGHLELDLRWQPEQWEFSQIELHTKELNLAAQGKVRGPMSKDAHVELSLAAPSLPMAVIKKYLPNKWLSSPRVESLSAAITGGELQLRKFGVNAVLSEISGMVDTGFDDRIWIDAEVRNLGANFTGGYLPIRGVQGRVTLEQGLLSFKNFKGNYGESRFVAIDGSYRLSTANRGELQIQARGDVDLMDLRGQLGLGLLPTRVTKAVSSIREIGGRGRFDVTIRQRPESNPRMEGKFMLDGARVQIENIGLTDIRGELVLTPVDVRTGKIRALLSGSPIQVQIALNDYASDNGVFDLAVDSPGIKAGVVTRLLLDSGTLQDPGMVRGSIRYRGSLATREKRKFTGNLDLLNVQLSTPPLLQPLRELNGQIIIDDTGIDFKIVRGLLVGFPASFSGRWHYAQKPQLEFDFAAPNLNISYLLSQIDSESSDFYNDLQARGKLALAKGSLQAFEFSDLKTDVTIERRVWRLSNPTLRSAGGLIQGVATIRDEPDTLGFLAEPKIQGVPTQEVLKWFEIANAEMTGKVNLMGRFESIGKDGAERKRNINGEFNLKIEDGTIRRLRIVVQILNLLDLSRWFTLKMPDLDKQGIRFRSVSGDFKIDKGVYTTQNLLVDSDDLRMTGSGKIDVPNDEVDLVVAVRPFAGIDTVIKHIPLIGRGIAAIKNSFLVASFNVRGPIDDPKITPAPLSTLSEVLLGILGVPKKLIGVDGEDKKEEPNKGQSKDPFVEKTPAPVK